MCTRPDRGYVPGTTLRSRMRAAATESTIRPAGLTKTSQDAPTHHQEMVGAALKPAKAARRLLAAIR